MSKRVNEVGLSGWRKINTDTVCQNKIKATRRIMCQRASAFLAKSTFTLVIGEPFAYDAKEA